MGNRAERHKRETEQEIKRMSNGFKWFWRGSEMAISEIEHLSSFINVNQ